MVHCVAELDGITQDLEGDKILLLAIPQSEITEGLLKLEGKKVVVDIKKYSEKRSIRANDYMWVLCTEIANACGTDKDSIFNLMLSRYGQYTDIECEPDSVEAVKRLFRTSEILREDFIDYGGKVTIRGYIGSSSYTSSEMYQLIEGVKRECDDYGIETWSQEEINRLIEEWGN